MGRNCYQIYGYVVMENHCHVDDPLHWRYSSARNYTGWLELLAVQT